MRILFTPKVLVAWVGLALAVLAIRVFAVPAGPWVTGILSLAFVVWVFIQARDIFLWSGDFPIRNRLTALGQLGGLLLLLGILLVGVASAEGGRIAEAGAAPSPTWGLAVAALMAVLALLAAGAAVVLASLAVYEAGLVWQILGVVAGAGLLVGCWMLPPDRSSDWLVLVAVVPALRTPWRERLSGRSKVAAFFVGFLGLLLLPLFQADVQWGGTAVRLISVLREESGILFTGFLRVVILGLFAQILVFQLTTIFSPVGRLASVRGGLRTKLVMFYLLAGAVPLVLMVLALSIGFYIILGGYRASLAKRIVDGYAGACLGWSEGAASDPRILAWAEAVPGGSNGVREAPEVSALLTEMVAGARVGTGAQYLMVQLETPGARWIGYSDATPGSRRAGYDIPAWADTARAGLVGVPDGVWARAVAAKTLGDRRLCVESGGALDQAFLARMKALTGVDFELSNGYWLEVTVGNRQVQVGERADTTSVPAEHRSISTVSTAGGEPTGLVDRRLYFGGAFLPEIDWVTGRSLERVAGMLLVRTSLRNLYQVLFAPENTINVLLLAIVGVLAGLFLVIIAVASGVGIRVVHNVTQSVGALKKGTQRVRAGDFEYRIQLDSRDEFQDLAGSFNVMSAEIRRMLVAVKEKEKLEAELRIARSIQQRLLPQSSPDIPGYQVTGTSISAREVGGDYFDYLSFGPRMLGLAIADVSGKGMTAALLMANLQASLRAFAREPSGIADVLGQLNTHLHRTTSAEMYATCFYGILDGETGMFTYANAGHNPPLLVRADGRMEFLEAGGLPLGMLEGFPYEEGRVDLAAGDLLILYTDGVTEAENAEGQQLGDERFREVAVTSRGDSAGGVQGKIQRAVQEFAGGHDQSDDLTVITLKVLGNHAA